jgi:GMP synthase (glutamine-hydrolysing)
VSYTSLGDVGVTDAVALSGSHAPWAAHDDDALARLGAVLLAYEGPVLGICAGMQIQARCAGGRIARSEAAPRIGFGEIEVLDGSGLLAGLGERAAVYHNHTDEVVELPPGFRVLARSPGCEIEAMANPERRWWGTQFHPERFDDDHPSGRSILESFLRLARA